MNLVVREDDMRLMSGITVEIFDEDASDIDPVGEVKLAKGVGRQIVLFNRYKGMAKTHPECVAFIKGVEAVLQHIIG
jgi:hypothetical protein